MTSIYRCILISDYWTSTEADATHNPSGSFMRVGRASAHGNAIRRSCVYGDFRPIENKKIVSATLRLVVVAGAIDGDGGVAPEFTCNVVKQAIVFDQSTYNSYSTGNLWNAAGASTSGTDFYATPTATGNMGVGDYALVTSNWLTLVQAMAAKTTPFDVVALSSVPVRIVQDADGVTVGSNEWYGEITGQTGWIPEYRPQVVIEYSNHRGRMRTRNR